MHTDTHIYIYIHTHSEYMYIYMCMYTYVCVYMYIYILVSKQDCVFIPSLRFLSLFRPARTYTHACMHSGVCIEVQSSKLYFKTP